MEQSTNRLDSEWLELILMAKQIGLTIEEIREFLRAQAEQTSKKLAAE